VLTPESLMVIRQLAYATADRVEIRRSRGRPVVISFCGSSGGAPVDDQVVADRESRFG
jgi:hypothetical protein